DPPKEPAFYGLAGRVVDVVSPYTEADPVAVLIQFLTTFGCAVNSTPHALVGATRHTPRLFTGLVGKTSKARKGASFQPVKTLFARAGIEVGPRVQDGLSTGEGLIWAVRDPIEKNEPVKEKGRVIRYERPIRFLVDPVLAFSARVLKVGELMAV